MKIRNKFMFSYLSVILIIIAVSVFISISGMKRLESKNMAAARAGVEDVVQDNVKLAQGVLTKIAEHFVVLRSESVALELKLLLEREKNLKGYLYADGRAGEQEASKDYRLLRKNSDIRALLSQNIFTPGQYHRIAGHVDLLDLQGEAVIHPNKDVEGKNYSIWKDVYPAMWNLVKASFKRTQVSGYYSFVDESNLPVRKFMSLHRVAGTSLIVTAVVEIDKYFLPIQKRIRDAGDETKLITDGKILSASSDTLTEFIDRGMWIAAALFLFGALLAVWQADSTSKPIRELSRKVREIGGGNFSVTVPEVGSFEIKELASSFNTLGQELVDYIDNLKKEVATREAIESEIQVARRIQESLLPHTFPPFPDRKEFELSAALVPAKEMSGDFYDFFFVDDKTLALIIADVSGKGLPAAIFMAVSRTLIRNLCLNGKEKTPAEIMTAANTFLCMDNDAAMFVTTFIAYYNIETGRLVYANAGHNPFLSLKKGDAAESPAVGKVEEMGLLCDLPLGVLDNYVFSDGEYCLDDDEVILFYTDGVTEALSPDDQFYGTERFYKIIEKNKDRSAAALVDILKEDVVSYQGDHQFDDITLMVLYKKHNL